MGANINQWQFPTNEAGKVVGWSSSGRELVNRDVALLNADGGLTISTTATPTVNWSGPFGGTWVTNHKLERVETEPTYTGNRGLLTIRNETIGNDHDPTGTGYIGWTDYAVGISSEKTDWLTTTVEGEVDGMHVALRNGTKGDSSAYLFNIKKVYDGTHSSGFTGVEGQSYWVDGTSITAGLHWGIKTTMPAMLKSADLRGDGVGLALRALGGTVADDNGRTSPYTGLAILGTAADGGMWYRPLVISSTEEATDRYFQITGGADRLTPTMHFGTPADDVVLRYTLGVFQIMNTGGTDPILNLNEASKKATFFGGTQLGSNTAPTLQVLYGGNATATWTSIAAQTTQAQNVTVTGAATGDLVIISPNNGFASGALGVTGRITAADTLTISITNPTAGAINPGSQTFKYLVTRIT